MIGNYIRKKRNEMFLSQKDFAKKVGVSSGYIGLIESNKRKIGKKKIQNFAKAIGVKCEEIQKYNKIENTINRTDKGIYEQKQEINILIGRMQESIIYLEKARDILDTMSENI